MALRAKKPVLQPNRFRGVIFGNTGVGKTHFVLSMPEVYYIDTEGVEKYKKFTEMLTSNNSEIIAINDLQEIINEVKELLSTKHHYKTLVIDSISVPCAHLSHMEAERLAKKSKGTEGTEFGANLAKVKRLTYQLGILLSRLDMNVIVTAHEKAKYENINGQSTETGKIADVNDKLIYCLGSSFHLYVAGGKRMISVQKTRYSEFKPFEFVEFEDGYGVLKKRFGEEVFLRESIAEKLATKEQIKELIRLINLLNIPEEKQQKWMTGANSSTFDEMKEEIMVKLIAHLKSQVKGEENV
jgi:hypothetical protein